ncbi:MAG: hypothetical protein J6U10_06800 [Lachnospiraceae bacterium]|nr:hypothetical protein [Lachnospiraceae bacterium]
MKKQLKFIIPVVLLAATVLGGVIYTNAHVTISMATAEGITPLHGAFSLSKGQTVDFNVFDNGAEIAADNGAYTVSWSSSDETVLYVDPATGVATADKDGLMTGLNGRVTVTVTVTEAASGKVQRRSHTVNVNPGAKELVTVVSGINEGMPLAVGTEYTLLSRTYDRDGENLNLAANQLFCSYSCDSLEITGGKFTPAAGGVYRIVSVGYATEEDLAAGTNEVVRDVLEVLVYAEPTPEPTPEPTQEPAQEPTQEPAP